MVALREETDRAVTKANGSEAARNEANQRADEWEEKQRKWQKKASEKQDLLDLKIEELILAEIKADRVRKDLERETMAREDQIEQLENKHKEAKYLAADAERKYEEVARKMNMMENDLEKAMNRAEGCEDKIVD